MNIDIIKEATIEHIENMYALSINYLNKNNNFELKNILKELEFIEDKIRICDDIDSFNKLKNVLDNLLNRIEVLINE